MSPAVDHLRLQTLQRAWQPVSPYNTRMLAEAFSHGMTWGPRSKGTIIRAMARGFGVPSIILDWEGFSAAMSKMAQAEVEARVGMIEKRNQIIQETLANLKKP